MKVCPQDGYRTFLSHEVGASNPPRCSNPKHPVAPRCPKCGSTAQHKADLSSGFVKDSR